MIIFDEKQYAEAILKNIKHSFMIKQRDLNILAKYYHHLGLNKAEAREKIVEYAKDIDDTFNEIVWDGHLDFALSHYGRNKLRTGEQVIVYTGEIEKLHTIENAMEQRVLFVMLIISKIFNKSPDKDYYYNGSFPDIFRLARLTTLSKPERINVIHNLSKGKYIEPNLRGGYKIAIADKYMIPGDEDIVIVDFDNMMNKFPAVCSVCKKTMEGTPRRRTYCDECYEEKRRGDIKKNVFKFRNRANGVVIDEYIK